MEHSQDIINECWRSIGGYINYQVSNTGRVRNASNGKKLSDQCVNCGGYPFVVLYKDGARTRHTIHKLVADEFIPKPDTRIRVEVDHIDNNKRHNTVLNLRWVSAQENMWNRNKIRKETSSKYIGVCFNSRDHIWQANIRHNDKHKIHLGYFQREKDAARAYNAKARELRGAFAVLNDISDDED